MLSIAVQQEKREQIFRKSIEGFPKDALKHTECQVKNPLPDKNSKLFKNSMETSSANI